MKIAIHSNFGMKFMQDIKDHWEKRGHEVFYEPGANPALAATCDLVYIDALDSNFYCLWNGPSGDHESPDWKPYPKKKVFVRGIDIDLWMGRHRDERIWKYMDGMIVINEFYRKMVQEEGNPPKGKLHLIRPGVNLKRFTFREKKNEYKIAMVTGNLWEAKAAWEGIRLLDLVRKATGKDFTLHIRGQHIAPEWHRVAYDHLIHTLKLRDKVTIYGEVGDMNEWLDDKDYILVTSYKEAFSYAAAEGMAKGLKPIINNFFGAADVWPEEYLYNNFDDAIQMFCQPIISDEYRDIVYQNYDLALMLRDYDDLLGT